MTGPLDRAPLAARLRTSLVAVGLVLVLLAAAALVVFAGMREAQTRLTRDYFWTIQDSNALFLTVVEVEDAGGSYLRSGDPRDLGRLQSALQPRAGAVPADALEERLEDAPDARAALQRARLTSRTWLADLQELVAAVQAGGPAAVSDAQREQARAQFETVRRDYDDYVAEVLEARQGAVDELDTRMRLLLAAVLLAVGTAVLLGVLLHLALRRWVTDPLLRLGEETRAVRAGALDHEVRADGPREIAALGDDVEAMRRRLVEQLAEVERAQRQLEQQADELRRSNRDLEQFAYVASHDLQEPLRKVSSFCQMLERRYKGQLDERADQYIAFAVDGAKRMQLLINDLLAFSRVGRVTEGTTEVAMDAVLADALRHLQGAVEDSGAVVEADPLPVVHGERRLLVQLLQNLIGNAIKFRGEQPPRIRVEARQVDGSWEFTVRDNGIGVEPQYAERIFLIFQRLHAKSEYDGTGIGLALCKKIVEHHGGTIRLEPHDGPGAVFRFTLPVDPPAPLDDVAPAPGAPAQTTPGQEAAWTAAAR